MYPYFTYRFDFAIRLVSRVSVIKFFLELVLSIYPPSVYYIMYLTHRDLAQLFRLLLEEDAVQVGVSL